MKEINIEFYEINKNDRNLMPFYENFDFEKVVESFEEFNIKIEDEEALFEEINEAINNADFTEQQIKIYKFYNQTIKRLDYQLIYEYKINFELYNVKFYSHVYINEKELYNNNLIDSLYKYLINYSTENYYENCVIERSCEDKYEEELENIRNSIDDLDKYRCNKKIEKLIEKAMGNGIIFKYIENSGDYFFHKKENEEFGFTVYDDGENPRKTLNDIKRNLYEYFEIY